MNPMLATLRQNIKELIEYISFLEKENRQLTKELEELKQKQKHIKK